MEFSVSTPADGHHIKRKGFAEHGSIVAVATAPLFLQTAQTEAAGQCTKERYLVYDRHGRLDWKGKLTFLDGREKMRLEFAKKPAETFPLYALPQEERLSGQPVTAESGTAAHGQPVGEARHTAVIPRFVDAKVMQLYGFT